MLTLSTGNDITKRVIDNFSQVPKPKARKKRSADTPAEKNDAYAEVDLAYNPPNYEPPAVRIWS